MINFKVLEQSNYKQCNHVTIIKYDTDRVVLYLTELLYCIMNVVTEHYGNCTGIFGFTVITILLVPFYWIPGGIFSSNPRGVLEDIPDAFTQIGNNPMLLLPILGQIKIWLNITLPSYLMI